MTTPQRIEQAKTLIPVERRTDTFLSVNGDRFRCACGGNVFQKVEISQQVEIYRCNSCGERYRGINQTTKKEGIGMTIKDKIKNARYVHSEETGYSTTKGYFFGESELTALLLAVQDEQIMKCRIKANKAGSSYELDNAIADTEYAYEPKKETA